MLKYDEDTRKMTIIAKDTGDFTIGLKNYLLDEGDVVYFTVNTEVEKQNPLIQKVITEFVNHKAVIRLTSADTDLPIGKYLYDIQINTADGRVDTVVGPFKFQVKGGVTY